MIQLVGPGGAGKTTVGLALAKRLGIAFVDLDEQFTVRLGDISTYLRAHEYQAYAAQNIQVCLDTLESLTEEAVIALSSGFMTYRDDAHPAYRGLHREIVASPSTVCTASVIRLRNMRNGDSAPPVEAVIQPFGRARGASHSRPLRGRSGLVCEEVRDEGVRRCSC